MLGKMISKIGQTPPQNGQAPTLNYDFDQSYVGCLYTVIESQLQTPRFVLIH